LVIKKKKKKKKKKNFKNPWRFNMTVSVKLIIN